MTRVHPSDREDVAEALAEMADGTFDDRVLAYRIVCDGGRVVSLEARVTAYDEGNGPRRIVGACRM